MFQIDFTLYQAIPSFTNLEEYLETSENIMENGENAGNQDLHSLTILKNSLSFVLKLFLYLEAHESNTILDWLNCTVQLIRKFCYFQIRKIFLKTTKNVPENGW